MLRAIATAVLLIAAIPCHAADFDVDALYQKWKEEDSRTLEGWRVLDDVTLIETLGPLGANYLLGIAYRRGLAGAPEDRWRGRSYAHEARQLRLSDPYIRWREELDFLPVDEFFNPGKVHRVKADWEEILQLGQDGFPCAYLLMSQRRDDGLSDEENRKTQQVYLEAGATDGCLPAMLVLGHQLTRGISAQRDVESGLRWLTKAAEAGYLPAIRELGDFYRYPDGQQPDLRLCRAYLTKAAEAGDSTSIKQLESLPEEELEGLKLSELFASYVARWPAPVESGPHNGCTILASAPNPVLKAYPRVGEWLKTMIEPDDSIGLSETEIAEARTMYADCLLHGIGGETQDPELAIHWLYQVVAADAKANTGAEMLYGEARAMHANGTDAMEYLANSVRSQFQPAVRLACQITLGARWGDYLALGYGNVPGNLGTEVEAISKLEELGEAGDLVAIQILRARGFATSRDALHWNAKAANLGDGEAALELYLYYRNPEHADREKAALALKIAGMHSCSYEAAQREQGWLSRIPAQQRCDELVNELAVILTRDASADAFVAAHPWIAGVAQTASVDQADGGLYGLCLLYGNGVSRDYQLARKLLKDRADDPAASFLLAQMMEQGLGAEPDRRGAIWVYEAVAEAGGVYAMQRLGELKQEDKEETKAAECFKKAAEGGCVPSMVELAKAYHDGTGIDKDAAKANEWAKKAADAGNKAAAKLLEEWKS